MAAYLDNVIIHSMTWQDHIFHLERVLKELHWAGLTSNLRKCHLGQTKAQYWGYHIGRGLLKPQEKKVEADRHYLHLETKKQAQTFLGLASCSCLTLPPYLLPFQISPERVNRTR